MSGKCLTYGYRLWAFNTAARICAGRLVIMPSIFAFTSSTTRCGSSTVQTQAFQPRRCNVFDRAGSGVLVFPGDDPGPGSLDVIATSFGGHFLVTQCGQDQVGAELMAAFEKSQSNACTTTWSSSCFCLSNSTQVAGSPALRSMRVIEPALDRVDRLVQRRACACRQTSAANQLPASKALQVSRSFAFELDLGAAPELAGVGRAVQRARRETRPACRRRSGK